MRFKLPNFTLTTRELTDEERRINTGGICEGRKYIAVEIRHTRSNKQIVLCVGSGVGAWIFDDAKAARSAISFAGAPWCADDPKEKEWMESYGEDLANDAFCHRILGKEMRDG